MARQLRIEVVYAVAGAQDLVSLALAEGVSAREAVEASGLIGRHGLAASGLILGIAGRRVAPDQAAGFDRLARADALGQRQGNEVLRARDRVDDFNAQLPGHPDAAARAA